MKTRIITALVGLPILFAVMALFNTIVFNIAIAALCLIAVHEVFNAFQFEKQNYVYWGFVPYILLLMSGNTALVKMCIMPATYLLMLYLALCLIANSQKLSAAKLGGMVAFSGVIIICFSSIIALKCLLPRAEYGYDALYFVFLILGFAWGGDTAAYFTGRAFGKHKLAPVVSPNKTVEGAVGGVFGSMLLGIIVTACYTAIHKTLFGMPASEISWKYYLIVALVGGVGSLLGIAGDLFASVIKRQCGIKDYGTIFPGHGGIMDRFDSVQFIAPLVAMSVAAGMQYFA